MVLAAWSFGCSTPPVARPETVPVASATPPSLPATASPPRPTAITSKLVSICVASLPKEWDQAFQRRTFVFPSESVLLVSSSSVTDRFAFGQFEAKDARGVATVDLTSGQLERIATFGENASGIASMVADARWTVWTQGNSATNLADWSLIAWDQQAKTKSEIDSSRGSDGQFAFGPQPLPALRDGVLAWAHYLPRGGPAPEAEIRVLDVATRTQRVVGRGTLSSPVFAGPYLLWAQQANGVVSIVGVDAKTYGPATLPDQLANLGAVSYLAGSRRAIAWTAADGSAMTVWDLETGEFTQYKTLSDLRHLFQFVQLRWPYAVWFGTVTHTVLDLRTGSAFDIDGTVGLGQSLIARSDRAGASARLAVAELDQLPPIGGCQAGR